MPSFEGNLLTQRHEICSHETRGSTLSYRENRSVSSGLRSVPGRDTGRERETDGQTERITVANMRRALRAVVVQMPHRTQCCNLRNYSNIDGC